MRISQTATTVLLAVALSLSIIATVMSVWPAVTNAPWEEDNGASAREAARDSAYTVRCEGALRLRETTVEALAGRSVHGLHGKVSELMLAAR